MLFYAIFMFKHLANYTKNYNKQIIINQIQYQNIWHKPENKTSK